MLGTVRAPMRAPECTHAEPHPRVPHATPMPPAPLARTSCDTAHACASVEAGPRVRAPCCLLRPPHAPPEVTHTVSPHRGPCCQGVRRGAQVWRQAPALRAPCCLLCTPHAPP